MVVTGQCALTLQITSSSKQQEQEGAQQQQQQVQQDAEPLQQGFWEHRRGASGAVKFYSATSFLQ